MVNRLLSKLLLLVLCAAVYLRYGGDDYAVVPLIAAVACSALCEYLRGEIGKIAVLGVFCICAALYPPLLFFLPVAAYDLWSVRPAWAAGMLALPLAVRFAWPDALTYAQLAAYLSVSWLLCRQLTMFDRQKADNITLRDSTQEHSAALQHQNKELLEKQEYEVNLAMLHERNRIAREMHDTVGHLLSSSILQTGALLATCGDSAQREGLARLQRTLSEGMDSVRGAIHDLHDESVDLYAELSALVNGFAFCPATLDYSVTVAPGREVKYAFIAIVKEGLANVVRHSNATRVEVAVYEHPALYQLVIRDNGTSAGAPPDTGGMGIRNIKERVQRLGGHVNLTRQQGFELFVSVPNTQEKKEARV